MKEEEEKMVVAKCNSCGRRWDINGCSVSGRGPFEAVGFICDRCQEEKAWIESENQRVLKEVERLFLLNC